MEVIKEIKFDATVA